MCVLPLKDIYLIVQIKSIRSTWYSNIEEGMDTSTNSLSRG